jgi:ligand-binding sensor domain-containing protein
VAVGPDGRLWAATRFDGAFVRTGGRWTREAEALPVTGVVPQADAVWVGTHQGVTRLGADGALVQYTEEGTTEHGLYDNVTDRLVGTADGAVWAVHPEGVSVFTDGEPHGYAFVGRRGAALHDVAALPGGGYVLATAAGVLHVPALSEKPEGFYEVYADSGADADALAVAPLGEAAPTRLTLSADGSALWFASRDGLWSLPVEALRPALAAR